MEIGALAADVDMGALAVREPVTIATYPAALTGLLVPMVTEGAKMFKLPPDVSGVLSGRTKAACVLMRL